MQKFKNVETENKIYMKRIQKSKLRIQKFFESVHFPRIPLSPKNNKIYYKYEKINKKIYR